MSFLVRLSHLLTAFVTRMGQLAGLAVIALMLVIVADVVLRRWFVVGSTRLQELEWHLHGALFLLSMGWAYIKGNHVRIELISERLKPRVRAWLELIGILVLLIPYTIALLVFGFDYAGLSWTYNEASASPNGLPARYVIKAKHHHGFDHITCR